MTIKVFILSIFIFICNTAFSQNSDSLVKKADLRYKNTEEKLAFSKKDLSNPDNIISLLLSSYEKDNIYSDTKAQQQINDCVKSLKQEIETKSEVKKVKYVYDYVHKLFLKVYKLQNSFSDIFSKGEYNCVSASALYAIIFTKLDIPFTIIEAPHHVYLVAFPQTFKILIETTSPEKGYYQFNDNFINLYVKSLYNSKLITKSEYETNTANQLFDKYYFDSKGLSLSEIVSLQYSNYAVYNLEEKKYSEAIDEIKKAYYLNQYERNKYILKSSLIYHLENNKYDKKEQVDELSILCRFNNEKDKEISNENIRNEFLRLTENQLINNSNYDFYNESYNTIIKEIKDTSLSKEIAFGYHYELARLGYLNNKDSAYELPHLRAAYLINAKNANLQSIILNYTEREVKLNNDPRDIIILLNANSKTFDFMNDNNGFNGVKANCILELSYQSFAINDLNKGEGYLKEFEALMNQKKETKANESFIEKAYSVAAGVYYKKGNVAKSKQTLKTGLLYAPDSFGLKLRLGQL
ncbi:MAG: hypothetical protein HY062_00495 [Bacteroidetes bacterium]|nr:hypothetical protein [Bacteroidota bacterium]